MAGEFEFIEWIRSRQRATGFVVVPPGDDLAVLDFREGAEGLVRGEGRGTKDLVLVGVDQVLEGRHFDLSVHPPEAVGRKAMNRNLSDCAAMGCLPAAAVVSVALPAGWGLENAKRLYAGLREAGMKHYCPVVGGDTGSWDGRLVVSVSVLGRSMGVEPVTRSGAAVGDGIYVTGPLGGSLLGRHLTFEPRVEMGRQLATYRPTGLPCIKAMIDVSDGLVRDLGHLLAANEVHGQLGAELVGDAIPVHPDAVELSRRTGRSALAHALTDGEDYELLFTSPVRPPLGVRVGTVVAEPGIRVDGRAWAELAEVGGGGGGWEHQI